MGKSTQNRKEEIARLRGDTFRTRAVLVMVSSIISVVVTSLVFKSTRATDENAGAFPAAKVAAKTSQVELTDSSHVTDARNLAEEISLEALCAMTDEQLAGQDIAYLNLRCAEDLPGFDGGIAEFLTKLDFMADWVGRETSKNLHRYHQAPEKFGHSVARFKAGMMVTILAQDFQCGYNPARGADPANPEPEEQFYADSKDLFVHGFLRETEAYGTCSSFPVLFAAVGRRLGYPIRLASTKGHLFCRWEDEADRFNIEGTNGGMKNHGDDHYKSWPYHIDQGFIEANGHIVSQRPRQELAGFLAVRANCLLAHREKGRAKEAIRLARQLAPEISYYQRFHEQLAKSTEPEKP
jgi:hypothetical protein